MKLYHLKNISVTAVFLLFAATSFSQKLAIKTNLPYLATATPNLGLEMGVAKKFTLDLSYGLNPFALKENKKWKHWVAQSELRYWLCEPFYGHFFGLHAGGGEYNISRVKIPTLADSQKSRYEGWATMAGISYGYSWILGDRWNMEATMGVGVMHTKYKKFDCPECGELQEEKKSTFLTPTKAAINILYMIK